MRYLQLGGISATPVHADPFQHMLVDNALTEDAAEAIDRDYPNIDKPGSFALADVRPGPAVMRLIEELNGESFRTLVAMKFGLDLAGLPTVFTLRGACSLRDGQIHTDSRSKLISILLYLNPTWDVGGGRLRLLRDGENLENFAKEIPPTFGRMLIFRRCDHSWHGHRPFEGPRRVLQMNYVTSAKASVMSEMRHRLSAFAKSF